MTWELEDILEGNVGFFWPQKSYKVDTASESERGYIERKDHIVEIRTLEEDPFSQFFNLNSSGGSRRPHVVVGATEKTGIILADVTGSGSNMVFGTAASVNKFRGRVLVCGVDVEALRSVRFNQIEVFFPGMSRWFGIQSSKVSEEKNKSGRLTRVSIEVRSRKPTIIPLNESVKLMISNHWSLKGPTDSRVVFAPVSIGVRSRRRLEVAELLEPVFQTQKLMNAAYRGFVPANEGRVKPHVMKEHMNQYHLWASSLMAKPAGADPAISFTEVPLFSLWQLGGYEAIAKWIKLCNELPRLAGPVADAYGAEANSIEAELLTSGATVDYWHGKNKKTKDWAKAEKFQLKAVVGSLPAGFGHLVGDVERWADRFWKYYTAMKHSVSNFDIDPSELYVLARSAHILVILIALNEISARPEVIQEVCESHHLSSLRVQIADHLN